MIQYLYKFSYGDNECEDGNIIFSSNNKYSSIEFKQICSDCLNSIVNNRFNNEKIKSIHAPKRFIKNLKNNFTPEELNNFMLSSIFVKTGKKHFLDAESFLIENIDEYLEEFVIMMEEKGFIPKETEFTGTASFCSYSFINSDIRKKITNSIKLGIDKGTISADEDI